MSLTPTPELPSFSPESSNRLSSSPSSPVLAAGDMSSITDASTAAEPSEGVTTSADTPSPAPSSAEPSAEPTTQPPSSAAPSSAEPTTPPPASSSASPQSSSQPESSEQPTTQPPSSSAQPTSSASPSQQQSSQAPSSDAASSQAPSSDAASSAAPVSSAAASVSTIPSELTSAIDVTTTDGSGHVVTTRPSVVTTAVATTDVNGKVYTVIQTVHNPVASNDSASSANGGSTDFFDNTGAVAGTFVVVGLAVTAGILTFIFFMLKRRRRQRLDRDVAAAAAAAAVAAHHSRSNFDDEDEEKANPAMTQYGGYYAATDIHGQPQPSMGQYDYEDPAGGYDPYAANIPVPGDRSSTATAPGLAGFGAQSAAQTYGAQPDMYTHHEEQYENLADPHGAGAPYGHAGNEQSGNGQQYYFDPSQADQFADDDAYGGYDEQPPSRHHRNGSEGSVARDGGDEGRGLRVANV